MNTGNARDFGAGSTLQATDPASVAGRMADKARDAGATVGARAENMVEAVGAGMGSISDTIRRHEPAEGMLHNAGEALAGSLESGGRYLEQHGLKGVSEDMTNLIRRNPIAALLVGAGIGILIARMVRR